MAVASLFSSAPVKKQGGCVNPPYPKSLGAKRLSHAELFRRTGSAAACPFVLRVKLMFLRTDPDPGAAAGRAGSGSPVLV